MCGIAGVVDYHNNFLQNPEKIEKTLKKMNSLQKHRGPDADGIYLSKHCGLGHVRLEIIDLETGSQPMTLKGRDRELTIVYNGEIYNMNELKRELVKCGAEFTTKSDTEVIMQGFALFGEDFLKQLNGIYAFALWDGKEEKLYLVRDPAGVKPLFYQWINDTLYFASELKGIFSGSERQPVLTKEGLCEVFALGPAKTYGKGVFKDVMEVKPGYVVTVSKKRVREEAFFMLKALRHKESYEETLEHVRYLVTDAVKMQMLSDVPICTFLSGGLDSSLVTSIISGEIRKNGGKLTTYSFDFVDNEKNFKENAFQPTRDSEYVRIMSRYLNTDHKNLLCSSEALFEHLTDSVDARDLPCMADVESSLLYFCKEVSRHHKVALTGECADEIFGGYPWFYKEELMNQDFFPWNTDWNARTVLLREDMKKKLPLRDYAYDAYKTTIEEAPVLEGESGLEIRRRQIQYLNLKWFMQTLLDRMDRSSMYCGLEARVPFADKRIISYLYNVPWEMKAHNGVIKGLLREAGRDYLPDEVYKRRKSPYPKTYDPVYEKLVKKRIWEIMDDGNSPIQMFLDREKLRQFCENPTDYGRPFYGQLMAGPQLLAYFIQMDYWFRKYEIMIAV